MIDSIEQQTAHRPWPLPSVPWVMFQSWADLLFIHWRVPYETLRGLVPEPLEVETFNGSGWVGQTPFRIEGLKARGLPTPPVVSAFPEMNLRTYVRDGGKPGIFFFSLDAASRIAVAGAQALYRLPYYHAEMETSVEDGWVHYHSRRIRGAAEFHGRYQPSGVAAEAQPGTLEHFLVERYALYAVLRNGKVLRGDIHHRPWSIQPAHAEVEVNSVPAAHGVPPMPEDPLFHFAARQDTLIWPPALV